MPAELEVHIASAAQQLQWPRAGDPRSPEPSATATEAGGAAAAARAASRHAAPRPARLIQSIRLVTVVDLAVRMYFCLAPRVPLQAAQLCKQAPRSFSVAPRVRIHCGIV